MRKFFSTEFAKLKEMTFTEKRQYIWEYYKLHLLFIGVGLFAVGSLINIWFINPPKRDYLYIPWQAGDVEWQALNDFSEKLSIIAHNQDRYRVTVRSYVLGHDQRRNRGLVTAFHARLTAGDIHAVIATSEVMKENAEHGLTRPMTEVMDILRETNQLIYDKLAERLLTVSFERDDMTITDSMAVSISGAPMLAALGLDTEDLYLAIIINSHQFERIASALAAIFEYEINTSTDEGGNTQ